MFGWLKQKILNASSDAMKNSIIRFTKGLEGADADEIASMLVIANILRLRLSEQGSIPQAALDFSTPRSDELSMQCDMCSLTLNKLIKDFQKLGKLTDAAGVMIWLHSVRALNVPENRIYGRKMWAQLERGFPYVKETLAEIREQTHQDIPPDIESQLQFIPIGLEPNLKNSTEDGDNKKYDEEIDFVKKVLDEFGYEITLFGIAYSIAFLMSGISPVSIASQIALITLAQDAQKARAEYKIMNSAALCARAATIVKILKIYLDNGLITKEWYSNDTQAMLGVTIVDKGQEEWLKKVLEQQHADEVLAISYRNYDE